MYAPVGQQESGVEQITNEPTWRSDYEREYSQYIDPSVLQQLEELPRATSAPPHLQERLGAASADILGRVPTLEGVDSFTDIRYDEDYPAFYELNSDKGRLPPPVDGNTLYNDMQTYMAQQKYKETAAFPGAASSARFGGAATNASAFGMGLGSQNSLSRGALETVEEQPMGRRPTVDESLADAFSHFQLGSEIQRPGSQPAPNLLQAAIAAGAGHIRSASAFPRFDVDGFAGMTGSITAPTSSPGLPAPTVGNETLGGALPQSSNLFPQHAPVDLQAAYQAAYQAALMQSQNAPQMVMQQSGMGMAGSSYTNGIPPHGMKPDVPVPGLQKMEQQPIQNYFAQPHPGTQPGMDYSGGNRFDVYGGGSDTPVHREERGGRGKRYSRRDTRDREREMNYGGGADSYYDSQYFKFSSIEEVVGQVMQVAQDQHGCRFLQRKFDEGRAHTIAFVFPEILENIVHLMKDPFGNYLIQKLLDRCSEEQRTDVVKAVAEKGELVTIALSTHGTRAVQKLIETLNTKEQRTLAIAALKPGVVHLIKDLNGNHVVQRCLQRLGPEDSQFIYDAAIGCCVEIASHRHGCCVLQRCIDFATHDQRQSMIMEISSNALVLSQDAFGNYVVQYVLDLGQPEASQRVMSVLTGHYSELAVQKFSSNVVEKCLKLGGLDDARESIIRELMRSPSLPRLLQDPYGNYVIQSALTVTSGSLHQSLVESIRPYLPTLRGTPHGKRILQKVLASLKDPFQP